MGAVVVANMLQLIQMVPLKSVSRRIKVSLEDKLFWKKVLLVIQIHMASQMPGKVTLEAGCGPSLCWTTVAHTSALPEAKQPTCFFCDSCLCFCLFVFYFLLVFFCLFLCWTTVAHTSALPEAKQSTYFCFYFCLCFVMQATISIFSLNFLLIVSVLDNCCTHQCPARGQAINLLFCDSCFV